MSQPAAFWGARWRDALPSGNGTIGAAVYGSVFRERVLLTHEDLWTGSKTPPLPDISDVLPTVRELLSTNRPEEAEPIMSSTLKERGYSPSVGTPMPLGDLIIEMPCCQAFKQYSRTLDMESGEVSVHWVDGAIKYERRVFVSRADNMVVCEIRAVGGNIFANVALDIHDPADARTPFGSHNALPSNIELVTYENAICYAAQNDDGTDFGAVAHVIGAAHIDPAKSTLEVSGDESVLICIKLFVGSDRGSAWAVAAQSIESTVNAVRVKASENDCLYALLLNRHVAIHGVAFKTATLDLNAKDRERTSEQLLADAYSGQAPTALVERMWAFGRYLLLSSSQAGGHPCPLHGLWLGEYGGYWSFNMANENLQMIYWQALSGNMCEALLPVFDYYERHLEHYRENARKLFGCRGIYICAVSSPESGLPHDIQPHILHWTGAAGWIAQHYFDYYLYTGNIEFLKNRAMPFMREAAEFYRDFLVVGADGYYLSMPSNSPENTPGNYWQGEHGGSNIETTINATMDFAIARELLTNLISTTQLTGLGKNEVPTWREMLGRIPTYRINRDGAVQEWMHPQFTDNYHHRHQSHLYPVFPGTEITVEEDPELFRAFATAVKKRLVVGLKEQSGWSLAHMANSYARMGEGDLALECLDILSRSCVFNNLYTAHNDWRDMGISVDLPWAPFQIDANMGWTSAVQEMLLFSKPGLVKLLPALPTRWQSGSVSGLLCRGVIEVDIKWDMAIPCVRAKLRPGLDQQITLKLPFLPNGITSAGACISDSPLGLSYRSLVLIAGVEATITVC